LSGQAIPNPNFNLAFSLSFQRN